MKLLAHAATVLAALAVAHALPQEDAPEPAPPAARDVAPVKARQDANFTPASMFPTFNPFGPGGSTTPHALPTMTGAPDGTLSVPTDAIPTDLTPTGTPTPQTTLPSSTPTQVRPNAAHKPTGGVFAAGVAVLGAVLAL